MNFLERIFGRAASSSDSAESAKLRLQMALAHDRADISPQTLDTMRDEIVGVVSKYVDIDRENVQVTVSRIADVHHVVTNVPVLRTHPTRAKPSPRRATRPAQTKS